MNLWLPLAVLLFGLPAAGLWVWLVDPAGPAKLGAREGLIWTAIGWTVVSVALIEIFSIGTGHDLTQSRSGIFSRGLLTALWLGLSIGMLKTLIVRRQVFASQWDRAVAGARSLTGLDRYLLIAVAVCVALVGFVAVVAAPNTWDSMTYHLARVAAWLQLGGVSNYATNAEPQLFQPPGAEMLIAQWQVLVGSDRMAAIVQFTAYLFSIGIASLIAARLGAAKRGQLLAAFLVATLPMAIMQGSSTQNDLITGLWLTAAAAIALALWQDDRLAIWRVLVACAAIGLAILTKGTAWIYLPPLLILLAAVGIKRLGWSRAIAAGAAGIVLIIALNAGQWQRNHETFGKYVYTGAGAFDYSNTGHGPRTLVSNLVRNGALYIGTPSLQVNEQPTKLVRSVLDAVGIQPDDPGNTFYGTTFEIAKSGAQESHGPSIVLFVLMLWALALALFAKHFRTRERLALALVVAAQIVIFALLIKWQPWHSRLHLPVALLVIPLVAVALEQLKTKHLALAVVVVVSLIAPLYLLFNVDRPVIGHHSIITTPRADQYFAPRRAIQEPYQLAVAAAKARGVDQLAMSGTFDSWYYPFNALLGKGVLTSYVFVANASRKYVTNPLPRGNPRNPFAIACVQCDPGRQALLNAAGFKVVPLPTASGELQLWMR
jgi:hypothetical protein